MEGVIALLVGVLIVALGVLLGALLNDWTNRP